MKKGKKLRNVGRRTISIFKQIILIIITLALIALQIALIYGLLFEAANIQFLYIFIKVLGFICVVNLIDKEMISSFKIIWIIIILVFPFVGTIFYLFAGDERTFPKKKSRKVRSYVNTFIPSQKDLKSLKEEDDVLYKHVSVITRGCDFPYYRNTEVTYFNHIDEKVERMLEDIKNAKKYIFIEYFIISSGKLLDNLIEALTVASSNGVIIKICYDDFGSKTNLKAADIKRLKAIPNLKLVKFAPLGFTLNLTVNYRNHRKTLIIDGEIGYMGGDNLADEYANYITRFGYWRDNGVRIYGEGVNNLIYMFAETWYLSTKEMLEINDYISPVKTQDNYVVMPYADGPTDNRNPAHDLYVSMINNAKDYLYISTPYLIIDRDFLNELIMAARSGVDVRILVPGIPDKKTVYLMSRSHFGELLKAGVKIYKYTPGFNHAKNFICDDKYGTVGSVNVDYRSLYLHFENGLFINDNEIVQEMRKDFEDSLKESEEITYEVWKKRPAISKIIEFVLKVFSTLM